MRALPRVLSTIALTLCAGAAAAQARVESFSPEGEVKRVRQVTARFSQPMVAFGDPRAPDPFTVDCAPKGRGRWVDGSTWSYDFEADLPGAMACRFTLRADSRDLAGQPLAGQRQFAFTSGGPAVLRSLPYNGDGGIDESQVFVLALDAPARGDSIERAAWCRADGVNEKIGLRVLEGEERARILALQRDFVDRHLGAWSKAGGRTWRAGAPLESLGAGLPLAVVQCRRTLPARQKIALVWGKGIVAPNGVATSADQHLDFRTRPDFTVSASCGRVNARAGCVPFLPVRVKFSAPVAMKDAGAIVLEAAGGKRFAPAFGKQEVKAGFVDSLSFPGPFPERSDLRLLLPPGLKDDAGRAPVLPAKAKLVLRTDRQPPLVKFAAPFGIIEAKGDRMLPVTVRNVEAALATAVRPGGASLRVSREEDVIAWMRRLNGSRSAGWEARDQHGESLTKPVLGSSAGAGIERFALPRTNGRRAFEVIGIPLRKPGFYVVEVTSGQLGAAINRKGRTACVHAGALVTNLAAHFKHGAQSSLVWVTSLDKGRPTPRCPGARASARTASSCSTPPARCSRPAASRHAATV